MASADPMQTNSARRRPENARTGAGAPDCPSGSPDRVRARPRRQPALPFHRGLGAARSEPGTALSHGGRAQSGRPVPGRARRRWRLAQAQLRGGTTCRGRTRAEPHHARALGRPAGDDPVRQRHRPCAAHARRPQRGNSGRIDLGRLFAAEPGPRQAQAHRRPARAGPHLRRRHRPLRQGARRARPCQNRAGREPQRRQYRPRHRLRRPGAEPAGTGARARRRGHRRRDHRQIPVHLRLHRPAQGGHQHPRHAHREPAAACADLAVSRRGAARPARLAAVEPHLRRQSQFQSGPAPRRHAVHRRRPAGARPDRGHRAQSRRRLAHDLFQCAGGLCGAAAVPRA